MKTTNISSVNETIVAPGVLPLGLSTLEGKIRCRFIEPLRDEGQSWVVDFELDSGDVDFSDGATFVILGDLSTWLTDTLCRQLETDHVLVNLLFKQ